MANAGASALAENAYHDHGLHLMQTLDMLALAGPLAKDKASATIGPKRRALFLEARTYYDAAYYAGHADHNTETYYPAINAAMLTLVADDPHGAREARKTSSGHLPVRSGHPRLTVVMRGPQAVAP